MKNYIIFFLPFFLILVLSSCKKLERNNPLEVTQIGDKLGDWGTVAYILRPGDIGYDANVPHGLIAASITHVAAWGCTNTIISGAGGTAIGTGAQNTIAIMNGCSVAGIAARLCGDLVLGGYNDWYLPSRDELVQLYWNRVYIGGFANEYYWSSTEYNNSSAWLQLFGNDVHFNILDKSTLHNVRAVRAF